MFRAIKSFAKSLPPFKRLVAERNDALARLHALTIFPPGHFYSPIASMDDVRRDADKIFDCSLRELGGIDLNVQGQLQLLDQLKPFYQQQPFSAEPSPAHRYYFENPYFSYSDAIFLYCIIRHAQPRRIIEIGAGFSSFVMLDTNDLFFDGRIRLTFIEPYPDRLRSRLTSKDIELTEMIAKPVQDVDLARFDELAAGDILFVDSSHVAKVASDVNRIVFEILPGLSPGVLVHFHDIIYPFEYPKEWIEEGRFWNEDYILRAFLQFNSAFKVRIWNQFLAAFHTEKVQENMPLCMKNGGGGLWLQRV